MRCVALVPLRGGSRGIPRKNIRPIAGKPLCVWVLNAALESGVFDQVVVSTEDDEIAETVRLYAPATRIVSRPPELATDTASTEQVMQHLAGVVDFESVCTIQATSPLTSGDDLREAHEQFLSTNSDSLLSVVRVKRFFWSDDGRPLNYDPSSRPRRQDFHGALMENGAFYFTARALLEESGCRLGGKISVYEMSPETYTEIDEEGDWRIVERLLEGRRGGWRDRNALALSCFFFDVDGTLTDGAMYYSPEGEALKRFFTRDGAGLQLLRDAGIETGIMSSENSAIAFARASKLNVDYVYLNVSDKKSQLELFCAERNLRLDEIAFMGDDLNDLDALSACGFSACPGDAVEAVKATVDYVCCAKGGNGAVREICELVSKEKRAHE